MNRVYNFSAGPSMLPLDALNKAASEMSDYQGSGMSVMEMSHRSKIYESIIYKTEELFREIMGIPDNYKLLFLQGGASSQFAMVPLNLFRHSKRADIVITGAWAKKAAKEISKYGAVNKLASSEDKTFSYIPSLDSAKFDPEADFFHITLNNTIYGTRFTSLPDVKTPLVTDASSCILSEPLDVSRFGVIYAGAQKNIGPAGLTVVIIRSDLIGHAMDITPTMFNYQTHVEERSMYNTPPTYSIYICKLVLEWLKGIGGIDTIYRMNQEKAGLLYDYLDNSSMFKGTVTPKDRSLMNVPFVTGDEALDASFVKQAEARGMLNLKGHRSVGGMRASIYNAMPIEGVKALVEFMKEFELQNK